MFQKLEKKNNEKVDAVDTSIILQAKDDKIVREKNTESRRSYGMPILENEKNMEIKLRAIKKTSKLDARVACRYRKCKKIQIQAISTKVKEILREGVLAYLYLKRNKI